jgi:hypothetical protein
LLQPALSGGAGFARDIDDLETEGTQLRSQAKARLHLGYHVATDARPARILREQSIPAIYKQGEKVRSQQSGSPSWAIIDLF